MAVSKDEIKTWAQLSKFALLRIPAFCLPSVEPMRRGRSQTEFSFARQCLAPALRSNYAWVDALDLQNELVNWNEDFDPVYRGDVRLNLLK